jgi:hypothetical protein
MAGFERAARVRAAMEAAVETVQHFRAPPGNSWARRTRWACAADGWDAGTTLKEFLEVDDDGVRVGSKAALVLSSGRAFDVAARDRAREQFRNVALLWIVHAGGVAAEVSDLNVHRDAGVRTEVYAVNHVFLYEPLWPTHLVRCGRAAALLQSFYGEAVTDVGMLPAVHPLSPEVFFTGALEGDVVEVVQRGGLLSHFVAVPTSEAQPAARRVLNMLSHPRYSRQCREAARLSHLRARASARCHALGHGPALRQLSKWARRPLGAPPDAELASLIDAAAEGGLARQLAEEGAAAGVWRVAREAPHAREEDGGALALPAAQPARPGGRYERNLRRALPSAVDLSALAEAELADDWPGDRTAFWKHMAATARIPQRLLWPILDQDASGLSIADEVELVLAAVR